jgi:hypothetical protein
VPKKPARVVRKALPVACSHLGIESGAVRGSVRRWRRCNGGYGSTTGDERAGRVCECSAPGIGVWRIGHECGPKCPGYQTAEPITNPSAPHEHPSIPPLPLPVAPGHRITIGDPPNLTPRSDRLVCTVAVGAKGAAMLAATGPLMERYAAKVGADFFAFTGQALNPSYPLGDKFRLHHLTPHYRRLLFIDADALIHTDAPDLFATTGEHAVWGYDDLPHLADDGMATFTRRVAESQGWSYCGLPLVLNTGVVMWSGNQPRLWEPPAEPLPAGVHVAEQCHVQLRMLACEYPFGRLGREWNYQWWSDRGLTGALAARPWVLHLAGLSQMHQVPGWQMDADAVRSAVLIAAAWAATAAELGRRPEPLMGEPMRVPLALPVLLATAVVAEAGGVTKLDSPPRAEWVTITADPVITTLAVAGDKPARWVLVDEGPQVDLRPSPDGKSATFGAVADGQYRVLVVCGEEVHRLKVVKAAPQPMPGPDNPPKPPAPVPPPAPVDPLVKMLQAGYDADTRQPAAKGTDRLDLVELYKQAGTLALDVNVTTTGQLVGKVKDAAKALGITGLAEMRKTIGAELAAVFPEDVPLSADSRTKAVEAFGRIKAALEQVK